MTSLVLHEDPVLKDEVARTVLFDAVIGNMRDPEKRAKAVREFHDIATLFNSLSTVLETVDAQFIELEARHEPIGFFSFDMSWLKMTTSGIYRGHGQVLPRELRQALEYFKNHDDLRGAKNLMSAIENAPWYNSLVSMVTVYNGLMGVYLSRIDKVNDLAKHLRDPNNPLASNRYSRIQQDLEECRDLIEKFAKSLEDYLQGYLNDFSLRAPLQRQIMAQHRATTLTGELFAIYSRVARLLGGFRALLQGKNILVQPIETIEQPIEQPIRVEETIEQPIRVEEPVRIIEPKRFDKPMSKALTVSRDESGAFKSENKRIAVYRVRDKNKKALVSLESGAFSDENKRVVVYGEKSESISQERVSSSAYSSAYNTPLIMAGIGAAAAGIILLSR